MDAREVKFSDHLTGNSSNTLRAPPKVENPWRFKDRRTCTHDSVKPSGNRVAVRKYREKKKAQTAYLEEEVKKLRVVNKVLIRKLQHQAALEAEAARLRSFLFDLKVKLDKEKGLSPFYKQDINGCSGGCIDHD